MDQPSYSAKRTPCVLIILVLCAGSLLRFVDLGSGHLSMDELSNFYPAQSLRDGKGFQLPSGHEYLRGADITRAIALTQTFFQDPELAGRLPAALFGSLNLILIAWITWWIAGGWAAFGTALLLAIYPEAIDQSRLTRFYTYQLNFGLLALGCAWRGLAASAAAATPSASGTPSSARDCYRKAWFWFAAAALAFLLAVRVHIVSLSVVMGFGACIAVLAIADWVIQRNASWRKNVPLQLLALSLLGGGTFVITHWGTLASVLELVTYVPHWASAVPGSPLTYYWDLNGNFPLLFSLLPAVFLTVFLCNARLAVLLACWFGVPFLLHSFIFAWKGERFILLAVPALFLAGGIAAARACGALHRAARAAFAWLPIRTGAAFSAERAANFFVAVTCLFVLATTPAFQQALKIPTPVKNQNWRAAQSILEKVANDSTSVVGSSMPLPGRFYFTRLDFTVGMEFLERALSKGGGPLPVGSPDEYAGVPILPTPASIRNHFPEATRAFIAIDPQQRSYGNLDPALVEALEGPSARELCRGGCADLELYEFPLDERQSPTP